MSTLLAGAPPMPAQNQPATLLYEPSYLYMMRLSRMFDGPLDLLQRRNIPYERRLFLLRRWRDERTRYLITNFGDMGYIQDEEMDQLNHALNALKRQPRKYI